MIAQQGCVIAVEGEDAVVRIGATSGCTACDAGRGCGAGIFGRLLRRRPVSIHVPNAIGARVGQVVQLGIPEERFLALVFRLYAIPLLAGLAGAALGFVVAQRLGSGSLVADLTTLVLAVVSAGLAMNWSRRRLGEFPLAAAVDLLQAAEPPMRSDCAAADTGRRSGPLKIPEEYESLKR